MRTITIEALRVHASIGILPHELASRQQLVLTVAVEMADAPTLPPADTVADVLDYRQLRDIAKKEAESAHINMLETLAGRITAALVELPGVTQARTRVVKPAIFPDCDGVAVEVTADATEGPAR